MLGTAQGVAALGKGAKGKTFPPPPVAVLESALLAMGPVALWLQDETAGVVGRDDTGNGHDGTYTQAGTGTYTLAQGALPPTAEGDSARYQNAGGVADRAGIFVPHAAALNIVGPGSIVSWTWGTFGVFNGILSKLDLSTVDGFSAVCRDGENFGIATFNAGTLSELEGFIAVAPTTAHLLVGRWGGGNASVWADGVKIDEVLGGFLNPGPAGVVDLEVGSASPVQLPGDVRNAFTALFNRALTDGEIAALWTASQ
jgi:hypothetical protein